MNDEVRKTVAKEISCVKNDLKSIEKSIKEEVGAINKEVKSIKENLEKVIVSMNYMKKDLLDGMKDVISGKKWKLITELNLFIKKFIFIFTITKINCYNWVIYKL